MNLILTGLVLLLFFFPGILFRRFYYTEEFSKEYVKNTFLHVFLSALLPSLVIQGLFFFIIPPLFGYKIDLTIIGDLLSNDTQPSSFSNLQEFSVEIALYHLFLFVSSSFMGNLSKRTIRYYNWDKRYKIFRFQNTWQYLLIGEFFDFPRAAFDLENTTVEEIEVVAVDALVETQEGTILYEGFLVDYELTDNSGLYTITLKFVARRYLIEDWNDGKEKKEKPEEASHNEEPENNSISYYLVPGHVMVLKYEEIINLNLTFYRLEMSKVVDENGEAIPNEKGEIQWEYEPIQVN